MRKRSQKPAKAAAVAPAGYGPLLAELKSRVRAAQVKASLSVNRELIALYWDIGRVILQRQQAEGWGAKVVARLAADLRAEFPEMKGFSERNIKRMLAFAREYPTLCPIVPQPAALLPGSSATSIVPQAAAQLSPDDPINILPQLVAKLPWFHHVILMEKVKDRATRIWYMQRAIEHGWSRAVLTVQIETQAHKQMGKALTNFAQTLPPPQSDLAQQVLKDPYTFDFLTQSAEARERELEQGLTEHIQKFLVELGVGFAFVGRQVHLEVGGEDYYLDQLFYHLKLRCFVVLDLKMEAFKPESAGKTNHLLYDWRNAVENHLDRTTAQRDGSIVHESIAAIPRNCERRGDVLERQPELPSIPQVRTLAGRRAHVVTKSGAAATWPGADHMRGPRLLRHRNRTLDTPDSVLRWLRCRPDPCGGRFMVALQRRKTTFRG